MEDNKNILAEGFYFDRPKEGSPEWVKGKISIQIEKAIPFLEQHANEKKYVNLDLLVSKEGKLYLRLNNWKPEPKTADQGFAASEVPF